jgi:hypothetical protein
MTTAVSTAVPPVVLVSANSLFLLTLTNRYSNLTNRLRQVTVLKQAEILYDRVLVMRASVFTATAAIFLQVLLILVLLTWTKGEDLAVCLFGASLVLMECSIVAFLLDVSWSSHAVKEHLATIRRAGTP